MSIGLWSEGAIALRVGGVYEWNMTLRFWIGDLEFWTGDLRSSKIRAAYVQSWWVRALPFAHPTKAAAVQNPKSTLYNPQHPPLTFDGWAIAAHF